MGNCIICNGLLLGRQRKFCSRKCTDRNKYIKNKDKIAKQQKEYKKKNPELVRAINKKGFQKFYKNKRERFNELMRQNYRRNKDKQLARSISHYYRKEILSKFNNKCKTCGSNENLEIHHIDYNWIKSNKNKVNNLELNLNNVEVLCSDCHKINH